MRLVEEAVKAGARLRAACQEAGIRERTVQRWRKVLDDGRSTAQRSPAPNQLSSSERRKVLAVVNSAEFCDLSPKQIVPKLADRGEYIASESTIYRVLRAEGQLAHRAATRPATARGSREHVATGPNQVWSWDITYLRSPVRGQFYFLYLVIDVWSRKAIGWSVHERETPEHSSALIAGIARELDVPLTGLVLHQDNGTPMKGATMLATMRALGIVASFSRPRVSDDNPYSEALFRTLKYRPSFPSKPFTSVEGARSWVADFVRWYNTQHLHSGISFVTPSDRHAGVDVEQLARRDAVYQQARARHPSRWSGATRNWSRIRTVVLNPEAAQPPRGSDPSRREKGVKELLAGEESRPPAARGRRSLRPDERRLSA
jgi:putative transposase